MLVSIEQISNLGVFQSYKKDSGLKDFGRYNIIYGLNGSGKTTLSRLLACLNTGSIEAQPDLKYSGKSGSGAFKEGNPYPRKIRVFNSEYVGKNIGEIEGQLNPIFIIGEEDKTLVEQIQADESALEKLSEEATAKGAERKRAETARGKRFTDIAKVILADTHGVTTRSYNKSHAERAFLAIGEGKVLSDAELETHRTTLQQKVEPTLPNVALSKFNITVDGVAQTTSIASALARASKALPDLCAKTAESIAIQRLQQNPDITTWVEAGLEIHRTHESTTCEYCRQQIPSTRLDELAKHFNDSDQQLKLEIEQTQAWVNATTTAVLDIIPSGQGDLYDELKADYGAALAALAKAQDALVENLNAATKTLTQKLASRTQAISCETPSLDCAELDAALAEVNKLLDAHNEKSAAFGKRTAAAMSAIETHHLTELAPDIKTFDDEIEAYNQRLSEIQNGKADGTLGTDGLRQRIAQNKQKVSNTAQAAKNLTDQLHTFLGRSDLTFEPEGDGYRIMRGEEAAQRLSEGEKTAITFIYFIVQLADQDFDVTEGIVVIDDPISSLDSNSVYQAFAFLKNAVRDAKQVFLLTHNFDFLKLLINWLDHHSTKKVTRHYMLKGAVADDGSRSAKIDVLDPTLLKHKSEYSFLFKTLYDFESDETIAGTYHIPNMARKLLETFLDFYYPNSPNPFRQLEEVDFDPNKKTAIYKFTNDQSHPTWKGFDPALVQGTQTNVNHLLEMIKTVSPIHFASLEKAAKEVS